jgi:23S rRNA (cytosine1962-C5)-methyltransferase
MKEFTLNSKKQNAVDRGENFFFESDLEESVRSCTPGEWITIKMQNRSGVGFVNTFVESGPTVTIIDRTAETPETYLAEQIKRSIFKRQTCGYKNGSRLIYGFEDDLPGLIVDSYKNVTIAQINNAGMDKYREEIKSLLSGLLETPVVFLDNQKYRERELLPQFPKEELPEVIEIEESGLKYQVSSSVMQKVGYYYDHRENRLKLENLLSRFDKKFTKGVDLFCYIGSWGLHALRGGVEHVDFVDQGNMEDVVMKNVQLNEISSDRASFYRDDVFKYLDNCISENKTFDLVVCDPPAFTKSAKNKNKAIAGYEKLYAKIFKLMESGGVLAAASCTQYISLEELDLAVIKMAKREGRRVQVLDLGIQGWDHPIKSLKSKSNYIKYLCYVVE